MTQIMTDWLIKFDKQMIKSQRKVLLSVDNAAPHPHLKLQNVEQVFFPKMTSHCQPFDQGIIQKFKKLNVVDAVLGGFCSSPNKV